MPYTTEISRTNPTCFLFLVDQSSSMLEPFGAQQEKQKAEGVADAINRLLQNLVLKCAKSEGIRDYFYVGIIGYGGVVESGLGGALKGQVLVPIRRIGPTGTRVMPRGDLQDQILVPVSAIAASPLRVEQRTRKVDDGAGGLIEQSFKFPVWFEARANGRTPMCKALAEAREQIQVFLSRYPDCYPPMVINITDGASTDGDPLPSAKATRALASSDGNVLLFNAHISAHQAYPIAFPATEDGLPDDFSRLLFRMSSLLPQRLQEAANSDGIPAGVGARGFVFNADLVSIIRFLDIGTRVSRGVR